MTACAQDALDRQKRTLARLATYARPTGHGDSGEVDTHIDTVHRPLSTHVKALITHVPFQQAIEREATTSNAELGVRAHQKDATVDLPLYGRYLHLITALSRRFGRSAVFGAEDAHQEAVAGLLFMARLGAAELPRRIRHALEWRVADEAVRHSRAVTGYRRDQVNTVRDALTEADGDRDAAREAVVNHPKRHRRMLPDTVDALMDTLLVPVSDADLGEPAEPSGHPGADTAVELLAEVFAHPSVTARDRDVLARYYGLGGYAPHGDTEVGDAYGTSRYAAARLHKRALKTAHCAAREVLAA